MNLADQCFSTSTARRRYIVTEKRSVDYSFDLSVVYPAPPERLTLITCDIPSYDAGNNFYWERLVVVAVPG
ncbi:MAG: hypothetical protein U0694_25080 [Anaerolineae bacterium]